MCVFLLFDTPSLRFLPPTTQTGSSRFASTVGAGSTWLTVAEELSTVALHDTLRTAARSTLALGDISDVRVYKYFFGIVVVQIVVELGTDPASGSDLAEWDSRTDRLQDLVADSVRDGIGYRTSSMWTTVLYVSESNENKQNVGASLQSLTKSIPISQTGFIASGASGIGMSWVEINIAETPGVSVEKAFDMVSATERDAIAFCAGMYRLYDDVMADYGRWLSTENSRSRSRSAAEFRYLESVRVHRNLHLGPSERDLNDGLWAVWGMPEMVTSLEASIERLERDIQTAAQRATALAQNALAIGAAVIAMLVGVEPVRTLFDLPDTAESSAIVLGALAGVELLIVGIVVSVTRLRRR